jgi:hypothetical protein
MRSHVLLLAAFLALFTSLPGNCEKLADLHEKRIPVEFILNGKFDGIGSLEFHLPTKDRERRVVYIYFLNMGKEVRPYVHIWRLSEIKMVYKNIVVFSGVSDYEYPFSGRIDNYGDPMKQRLVVNGHGQSALTIKDLLSDTARSFKTKYMPKVHLGTGPYMWTK